MEELRKKCEDLRRDYEKRKEHMKEDAARRSKALAEDNKQLQRWEGLATLANLPPSLCAGSWLPSDRRHRLWSRKWNALLKHLRRCRSRTCDFCSRSGRRMTLTLR